MKKGKNRQRPLLISSLMIVLILTQLTWAKLTPGAEVPTLKARVNDYASMLSPATRQQLERVLALLEQEESTQLAVLTINSLEGENLEAFSLKVVEKWQLGKKGIDNGALLLIAKGDRKIRIEVGYGLEGVLTDLRSGRIIRDIITPQFKDGDFDQGVIAGVSAMIAAVRGEFSTVENAVDKRKTQENIAGFIIVLLFAINFIGRTLGRNKILAATIGAIIFPGLGLFFLGPKWPILLALIPAGFLATLITSMLLGRKRSSQGRRVTGGRHYSSGGFGGGGSFGGGTGGFGGFSGGGGGFGGGGSSGGW